VAVHVSEASAVCLDGEHRKAARPACHPRHWNAGEEGTLGSRGELARTWVLALEAFELAGEKIFERHRSSQST
jgi:hypothetical protein